MQLTSRAAVGCTRTREGHVACLVVNSLINSSLAPFPPLNGVELPSTSLASCCRLPCLAAPDASWLACCGCVAAVHNSTMNMLAGPAPPRARTPLLEWRRC
jgi:hypothetical protein